MNINAITKHYDKLTINERFALMQAAINRGDDTDRATGTQRPASDGNA
jgi:hypothetical protein